MAAERDTGNSASRFFGATHLLICGTAEMQMLIPGNALNCVQALILRAEELGTSPPRGQPLLPDSRLSKMSLGSSVVARLGSPSRGFYLSLLYKNRD